MAIILQFIKKIFSSNTSQSITRVVVFALMLNLLFGVLFYFAERDVQPELTMVDSIWWAMVTMTTVGYGDIIPVTDIGKIVAIFFMFFGIGVLAIFLSVLGTMFYKRRFEQEEKEISHAQKLILARIDDLEKNQEKLQKDLREIIDKIKLDSSKP